MVSLSLVFFFIVIITLVTIPSLASIHWSLSYTLLSEEFYKCHTCCYFQPSYPWFLMTCSMRITQWVSLATSIPCLFGGCVVGWISLNFQDQAELSLLPSSATHRLVTWSLRFFTKKTVRAAIIEFLLYARHWAKLLGRTDTVELPIHKVKPCFHCCCCFQLI